MWCYVNGVTNRQRCAVPNCTVEAALSIESGNVSRSSSSLSKVRSSPIIRSKHVPLKEHMHYTVCSFAPKLAALSLGSIKANAQCSMFSYFMATEQVFIVSPPVA